MRQGAALAVAGINPPGQKSYIREQVGIWQIQRLRCRTIPQQHARRLTRADLPLGRNHRMAGFTRVLALVAVLTGLLFMGGCNTIKGVGRDLESAGQSIQHVFRR